MPTGAKTFHDALRSSVEVYHTLGALLEEKGYSVAVGDEGGFAPNLKDHETALDLILCAIQKAGYRPSIDFMLAIDAATSEWALDKRYQMPKNKIVFDHDGLIEYWKTLCDHYPIASIEDPLGEEDWEGWKKLTAVLGKKVQLVGDDLFVTNLQRLQRGVAGKQGTAVLVKPNQIGTLSETAATISYAKEHGYRTILSHRSGETEDPIIADLAVGFRSGQIKTGAPCRSERNAKYNRLLGIEEWLDKSAVYHSSIL